MSDYFMNLFPADPRLPKPDWPRLRAKLLEHGFMRDPKARSVDRSLVRHLWQRVVSARGQDCTHVPESVCDLNSVFEHLKTLDLVPKSFVPDCRTLGVDGFICMLKAHGYVSPQFEFPEFEKFSPGPLYWKLSGTSGPDPRWTWTIDIYFEDFDEDIHVTAGEGLFEPPGIPGTDRVCEEWSELMDRWCKDPNQQWIDPETGNGYGILNLDWDHTLGAGRCWLEIDSPCYLDGNRAAALLTELTGQTFLYCRVHI